MTAHIVGQGVIRLITMYQSAFHHCGASCTGSTEKGVVRAVSVVRVVRLTIFSGYKRLWSLIQLSYYISHHLSQQSSLTWFFRLDGRVGGRACSRGRSHRVYDWETRRSISEGLRLFNLIQLEFTGLSYSTITTSINVEIVRVFVRTGCRTPRVTAGKRGSARNLEKKVMDCQAQESVFI